MRNLILAVALLGCGGSKLDPKNPYSVDRRQVQIPIADDLQTQGSLTRPDKGDGPFPTVVLVADAGPMDMDHTLSGPQGPVLLFADLAEALSERGFTVVRYHKRHVTGFRAYDLREFVADDTPLTQAEDLAEVVTWARAQPDVDPAHLFLYGVGEGGQAAAQVAREADVAGLILHGAPGEPYPERMRAWFHDLVVPYLEGFGYDGVLDGYRLADALNAPVSRPIQESASMLAVSYTRGGKIVKVSPLVDIDRDSFLDIERELEPRIDDLVELAFGPIGNLRQHAGPRALPTLDEAVKALPETPILVLQGMSDATVRPVSADRIEAALAGHRDHTVERFRWLGHTLGAAQGVGDDLPRRMDDGVVDTLVDWLVAHAR